MKTVSFKKRLTPFIAAGFVLLSGCGSGKDSKSLVNDSQKSLKIAYLPLTHSLPMMAANELPLELRQNKNLELVKFGSWPELIEALNAGKVDGASVLVELAIKAKEQGFPLKSVALGHRDGNVVVVAPEIKLPTDLIGKTIAIPHRLSSHNILLNLILEEQGIDPTTIKITELPPPEMPAALASKQIAAYIVAEPFGAKGVVAKAGRVLYQSPDLWKNSICCTLVINEVATKDKSKEVKSFVNDYLKAADSLSKSRAWEIEVAKKYMKVEDEVIRQSLEWISFDNLAISHDDYKTLSDWMLRLKLSEAPASFASFVDTTYTQSYYSSKQITDAAEK